jgi:hypothetical protein
LFRRRARLDDSSLLIESRCDGVFAIISLLASRTRRARALPGVLMTCSVAFPLSAHRRISR